MCVLCVCVCSHMCRDLWSIEECGRSPVVEVIGSCELLDIDTGNWTERGVNIHNHGAISSTLLLNIEEFNQDCVIMGL